MVHEDIYKFAKAYSPFRGERGVFVIKQDCQIDFVPVYKLLECFDNSADELQELFDAIETHYPDKIPVVGNDTIGIYAIERSKLDEALKVIE